MQMQKTAKKKLKPKKRWPVFWGGTVIKFSIAPSTSPNPSKREVGEAPKVREEYHIQYGTWKVEHIHNLLVPTWFGAAPKNNLFPGGPVRSWSGYGPGLFCKYFSVPFTGFIPRHQNVSSSAHVLSFCFCAKDLLLLMGEIHFHRFCTRGGKLTKRI